ncbi:unnamed protein product [Mytilus edulis]|uniref:Farnesoic acid O-methyl transferase domain-containing protein n=1 Tax=Mytilus edulis TaxID=6550 RepID=A0A8S3U8T2_MYTED|nr:unnamed protein product [Mytilus edulis]
MHHISHLRLMEKKYFSTPDTRSYTIVSNQGVSADDRLMTFKVKACSHAYVGLMSGQTETDPLYEIVLGGMRNTYSKIRAGKEYRLPDLDNIDGPIVNCSHYVEFWIIWNDYTITVGLGLQVTRSVFLTWTSSDRLLAIKNIGIATGFGDTGEWTFYTKDKTSTNEGTTTEGTTTDGTTTGFTTTDGTTTDGTTTGFTTTDGTTTEGTTTDGSNNCAGQTTEGTTTEDQTTEAQTPEGTTTESTTTDGTLSAGTTTEGLTIDGTTNEGHAIEDTTTEGQTTEGQTSEAKTTEGTTTEGRTTISSTNEGQTNDGTATEDTPAEGTTSDGCTEYCTKSCTCKCEESFGTTTSSTPVTQYKVDKKTLSSYKRRYQSASDPRKSSFYIGCVGITVLVVSCAFVVILDFVPRA